MSYKPDSSFKSYQPEYQTFSALKQRCFNPKNKYFKYYGARGITVEWKTFAEFYRDMGPRPGGKHEYSIERKDNDGPYSKNNCYWANWIDQGNNKRWNRKVEYNGQVMTLPQLVRLCGVNYHTLSDRLERGWTVEQAIVKKNFKFRKNKITHT